MEQYQRGLQGWKNDRYRLEFWTSAMIKRGGMAEWSKALRLGSLNSSTAILTGVGSNPTSVKLFFQDSSAKLNQYSFAKGGCRMSVGC